MSVNTNIAHTNYEITAFTVDGCVVVNDRVGGPSESGLDDGTSVTLKSKIGLHNQLQIAFDRSLSIFLPALTV